MGQNKSFLLLILFLLVLFLILILILILRLLRRIQKEGENGDGKHVLTASVEKTAILWEAASAKKIRTFPGHTAEVWSVALSGDSKYVLTGSEDKTAVLWEAASGKKIHTFEERPEAVYGVALSGGNSIPACPARQHDALCWGRLKAARRPALAVASGDPGAVPAVPAVAPPRPSTAGAVLRFHFVTSKYKQIAQRSGCGRIAGRCSVRREQGRPVDDPRRSVRGVFTAITG